MAHGAVAKILDFSVDLQRRGREQKGNRRGGQQVRVADAVAHRTATRAQPGHERLVTLKKSAVIARALA